MLDRGLCRSFCHRPSQWASPILAPNGPALVVSTCPLSRSRGRGDRIRLVTSGIGTFVWTGRALQAECDDLEMIGLALLYPALERSVWAPGHHGYPRASDLILRKALKGR
jgi:hypothetical protein